jgi:hypothetical protein
VANPELDPLDSLDAVKKLVETLRPLDVPTRLRVMKWASELLGMDLRPAESPSITRQTSDPEPSKMRDQTNRSDTFDTEADLFAAADPGTDVDRALVMGYWFQCIDGEPDFDSQSVNSALKNMGHGVGNITLAFGALSSRRPQLVIQTKKAGTSKQARKRFKLTTSGIDHVERMIAGQKEVEED